MAGRIVAVFNVDGAFHALDGICPHSGGPLAKGTLRQNVVTCPWHGWTYGLHNGKAIVPLAIRMRNAIPLAMGCGSSAAK